MKKPTSTIATINMDQNDMFLLDSGMPGMKIRVSIGEKERCFYLYPFRGYSFQVCSNKDGQGDCGSTEVIGLGNVLDACTEYTVKDIWGHQSNLYWKASHSVVSEIYAGMIHMALNRFITTSYFPGDAAEFKFDYHIVYQFAVLCTAYVAIKLKRDDVLESIVDDKYNFYITDGMKDLIHEMSYK